MALTRVMCKNLCVRKQSVKSNTKVNKYAPIEEDAHKDLHC